MKSTRITTTTAKKGGKQNTITTTTKKTEENAMNKTTSNSAKMGRGTLNQIKADTTRKIERVAIDKAAKSAGRMDAYDYIVKTSSADEARKARMLERKCDPVAPSGIVPRFDEVHARKHVTTYRIAKTGEHMRGLRRVAGVRLADGEMYVREALERAEKAEKARDEKVMTWAEWDALEASGDDDDTAKTRLYTELKYMVLHVGYTAMVRGRRSFRTAFDSLDDVIAESWLLLGEVRDDDLAYDERGFRYVLAVACGRALDRVHNRDHGRKDISFEEIAHEDESEGETIDRATLAHVGFTPADAISRGLESASEVKRIYKAIGDKWRDLASLLINADEGDTMQTLADMAGISRRTMFRRLNQMRSDMLDALEADDDDARPADEVATWQDVDRVRAVARIARAVRVMSGIDCEVK